MCLNDEQYFCSKLLAILSGQKHSNSSKLFQAALLNNTDTHTKTCFSVCLPGVCNLISEQCNLLSISEVDCYSFPHILIAVAIIF